MQDEKLDDQNPLPVEFVLFVVGVLLVIFIFGAFVDWMKSL